MKSTILLLLLMTFSVAAAGPRDAQWQSVEEARRQGLPRTAIERLQPIIEGATRDAAWPEAARAIGLKITLEAEIQGNRAEERVTRFEQAVREVPQAIKPIFHALLGHAYWGYFEQNRWRIQQRTATVSQPSDDFQTWDLRRLFAEIDRQFTLALAEEAALKATPIADFAELLPAGTLPDRYRPTLYDFLVHEALEFYRAGEQAGARPQDAFIIKADTPVLAPVGEFLAWEPSTTDTNSVACKAIRLYQALLRFHQNDTDRSAFLDADLSRLQYGGNLAVGPDKDERYISSLRELAERARDHEVSAMARYEAGRRLQQLEKPGEAHAEARQGVSRFPESPGGKLCRNLIRELEAPSAGIVTERVWNAPWPVIRVTHKNTTRLWFRAVAADWNQILASRRGWPEQVDRDQRRALVRERPAAEWTAELPATPDFKQRLTEVKPPENLAPGFYYILASRRAGFEEEDNEVSMIPVWVSDLALVVRTRAGRWEGFVLEARTGEPLAGARVEAWYLDQRGERRAVTPTTTDTHGLFAFEQPGQPRAYLLKATHQGRTVAMGDMLWAGEVPREQPRMERTVFFTDRSLYRPGQLIQYKGICLVADSERDRYEPIAGRQLAVVLRDLNGRELARAEHRANDFGSFAGTFTAPSGAVTGEMQLVVERGPEGATAVRVEEYKRPKFRVTLQPPAETPLLEGQVTIRGTAMTYTGAPLDGSQVLWRVVRQVRFPMWFGWFRPHWPSFGEAQEIANGVATTELDGSFTIQFPALPDPAIAEKDEPIFQFEVHADVTDGAGETRSADRTVNIGYAAITAELSAGEWQSSKEPIELRILTQTLDGEGTRAEGTIRIHRLKQPERVHRRDLEQARPLLRRSPQDPESPDPSDPNSWELGEEVLQQAFQTATNGVTTNRVTLNPGAYRAVLETRDRFGRAVTARVPLLVVDPDATKFEIPVPFHLTARSWRVEPGEQFVGLWGTGYETGRAFIEIERKHRLVDRFWTEPGRTQQQIQRVINEAMRGGFVLHVTYVRENRAYQETRVVEVPWTNKELDLAWDTFRSRLEPGQKETWTATIRPKAAGDESRRRAEPLAAEMVATLYDASLDQFLPFDWLRRFDVFHHDFSTAHKLFANRIEWFSPVYGHVNLQFEQVELRYRDFPPELVERRGPMVPRMMSRGIALGAELYDAPPATLVVSGDARQGVLAGAAIAADAAAKSAGGAQPGGTPPPSDLQITPRRNLQETAFFLPHLTSDSNGVVRLTFTLPEALTQWKFLGFAHDRRLRSGFLGGTAVTTRDLMVQPNPPRFLREGDTLEFTAKVLNQSVTRQSGRVRLTLRYAQDESAADAALGNTAPEQTFDIPAGQSRSFSWRLQVPDGAGLLTYKVTATTDRLSDGEEGYLPVLSRRVLVTESLALSIRGPATNEFTFADLQRADSPTLRHQQLTVQMASNPAWYAVLALPYLMESQHECSEQVFNRLYANALARHIANGDRRIRAMFESWRGTDALRSPLEKSPELKAIALEETPWLADARTESESRQRIGMLFEANRLDAELNRAMETLAQMQLIDGSWPWFPNGPGDLFMTLYITSGFGRLRHLGIDVPVEPAVKAIAFLDQWMHRRWQRLRDDRRTEEVNLDPTIALYLYARAFYLQDRGIAPEQREAFDYWIGQAQKHWLKLEHRLPQGNIALALWRTRSLIGNDTATSVARSIVQSLLERSVRDDELGRYWREDEHSWSWFRAPIETQALMIELFDEVAADSAVVEDLKIWLLKQKQTQNWKATRATADAVYALVLRGMDLLRSARPVAVELGSRDVTPGSSDSRHRDPDRQRRQPEPGTGFYEVRFAAAEITPELARVTVRKQDQGIAWGGVHWQYFEDVSRVEAYAGTPLKLTKSLFTRENTATGPQLTPVTGPIAVGDEVVVRIELRVDRDMEYVHLKDQRGSGTEPINVLSLNRYQDGLGYYESTRDAATHFFISYLPKGTYVFEYPVRVQHRGEYPSGYAAVQCMYAPEFNSHSASIPLVVQ